jgi:DNA polymerase III subunit gamma/tau
LAYVSLYRKYRSQTFGDLVGQDHVVKTLQNAIKSERIAHSYLFTGPRGTGKTSSARLLAKALCCEKGPAPEPCNECELCVSITAGNCIDVYEMDAASDAGVEEVRETIIQVVEYRPAIARYKVFIIDEVHDLSGKAFDALLKTIEEPPDHVIFILATTEYTKVPPTIRSRCQKFEFHRGDMQDLIGRLEHVANQEGAKFEPAALAAIARMADGGYRDALTLLEQALLTAGEEGITLSGVYDQLGLVADEASDRILLAIKKGDVPDLLSALGELARLGRDPRAILESLLLRLADLTRVVYGLEKGGTADAAHEAAAHATAVQIGQPSLLTLRGALADSHREIRDINLPRVWLESELIRIGQQMSAPAPAVAAQAPRSQAARPAANAEVAVSGRAAVQATAAPPPQGSAPDAPSTPGAPAPTETTKSGRPAPEPTGDPELDQAREVWHRMVESLPAKAAITLKLTNSELVSFRKDEAVVELSKMNCDWIQDDPRRQKFVLDQLETNGAAGWKVRYQPRKAGKATLQPEAVELPAEGERLEKLAREVFKS